MATKIKLINMQKGRTVQKCKGLNLQIYFLFCFSLRTVKSKLRNFLVERSYRLLTLVAKMGFEAPLWTRVARFSRSGRPKRWNLENCGGKNVRARLGPFHLNWPEPVLFGRPERTNGKRPK